MTSPYPGHNHSTICPYKKQQLHQKLCWKLLHCFCAWHLPHMSVASHGERCRYNFVFHGYVALTQKALSKVGVFIPALPGCWFSIPCRVPLVYQPASGPSVAKATTQKFAKKAPAPEAAPVGGVGEGEIRFWVPPLFLRLPIFLFHRVLQRVLPAGGHTAP